MTTNLQLVALRPVLTPNGLCGIAMRTGFGATRSMAPLSRSLRPSSQSMHFANMRACLQRKRRGKNVAEANFLRQQVATAMPRRPIMNPQPDDVNPCGIDKAAALPRRKYGGLLVATLPCGRVCAVACLQPFDQTLTSWLSILFTYNQWHEVILFSCPPLPQPLLFTTLLPSVIPSVAAPCLPRCIHWPTPSRSLKCTACCRPCSIEVTMLWRMPFMTTLVLWPAMRATRCVVTERRRRRPSLPSPSSSTASICRITRRASLKATTSSCPKFDARGIPSSLASTHRLPNSASLGPTPLCDPRLP